ncbi:hypothetical protein T440DRAFT_505450 [Plenodomus tracheiphilus IPT5]|uniref:Developmental regulator n=1 Tax=Plenodomus tracheiphilus IPT5 TaxID=1408161 RepID=A0A6A7BHW1_9PLEO|nr:hypothetical protein T440DRAFT_505450 [Plenodomus tracheiphilus IPT5]
MPTWLVHGFRWPRAQIRIHIILQNLDDAAPEWLMAPATTACMLKNFKEQWPAEMAQIPDLRFIEQYDPEDLTVKDQPYAYVCDIVHEVKLGVDVDDIRGAGLADDQWAALAELRDKVAADQKLGWFVVVNGDVERWAPPLENEDDDTTPDASLFSPTSQRSSVGPADLKQSQDGERSSTSKSLKKWIGGKLKKTKSGRNLRADAKPAEPVEPVPPLPKMSPSDALHEPQSSNGSNRK